MAGFFLSVTLLCLTRSIYHLAWLVAVCALPVVACYKKQGFQKVLAGSLLSVLLVSGWYVKNYLLFGIFSVSSWTGINFSRIVFHDVPVRDSATIAAIHPFLPVSYYKRYISAAYIKQYAGRADRVLLSEMKSDTAINMNNAGYLQVAEKYLQASKDFVRLHPAVYLKHAATSFIIFFSPASSYFQVAENCDKMAGYDLVYSFNLSHLVAGKENKKLALAVSAIPRCLLYLLVFLCAGRRAVATRRFSTGAVYSCFTILFVLIASTLFEYGENMRFRYEVEPLFLILAAKVLNTYKKPRNYSCKSTQGKKREENL